jgi:bifunctional DNA primase/polymerase-like protein/AAA domain-containing protein/primase-like protein
VPTLPNALEAIGLGFAVIPVHSILGGQCSCGNAACPSPGKHPIADLVPNGVKQATKDQEIAREWWAHHEDANVGIATGSASGVCVLDVDERHGGGASLARLMQEHGAINTPTVKTGDGFHFYVATDGEPIRSKAGFLPGLDLRGEGSYVVYPGSSHKNGNTYAWMVPPNGKGFAPFPSWLPALTKAQDREPIQGDGPDETIPEGHRNAALASLAGTMRKRGMSEVAIEAALLAENRKRCNPPLSDTEIRAIAQSIGRYAAGTTVPADPQAESADRFLTASIPGDDLLTREIPTPHSLVGDGVVTEADLQILYGSPGLGKSWLALHLAVAVSRGAEFFGMPTEKVRVGILSMELPAFYLQERLRTILGELGGTLEGISVVCRPELRGAVDFVQERDLEALRRWIQGAGLGLVIIDPLSRVHRADEKDSAEFAGVLAGLEAVRQDTKCAVLVVHHERKTQGGKTDADLDALRGTSRLVSDPTSLIRLTKSHAGVLVLRFPKLNYGPSVEPIYLEQTETGVLIATDRPESPSESDCRRILEAVGAEPGITLESLMGRAGLARATAYRRLKMLGDQVRREGKGLSQRLYLVPLGESSGGRLVVSPSPLRGETVETDEPRNPRAVTARQSAEGGAR